MPVDEPFNIYREELSSHYHGLALWDPKPVENLHKQPGHVSIGDVGYLDNGTFMRMFNVTLPWDDPSNKLLGKPEKYKRIKPSYSSNVRDNKIREGEYHNLHVSKVDNVGADRHEDALGQMYQCRAQHRGALLFLPHKGNSKDIIPIQVFKDYIRDNVDSWFRWSKKMKLPVGHMEDLILVTGCTLVTSWAAAAFDGHMQVDSDATAISLEARKSHGGGAQFFWRNNRGMVEYHNSHLYPSVQEPQPQNQCIFFRGFRAKRTFFRTVPMRAAAEPLPDDPDDRREDGVQVTRIPDSSRYRDPLVGILDYIIQCNKDTSVAEDIIAIAHDDDLQLIEGVETLTADAIENFLQEKQMPLIVENGSAILRNLGDNIPPVSNEKNKGWSGLVDQPYNIYREQLSSQYHGLALWDPKPVEYLHKQPGHVSIGDVGYLDNGAFMRMFNVTLPWDDPSNKLLGEPEKYERLVSRYFDSVIEDVIREGEYYTLHVSKVVNVDTNRHEDSLGQMYQCRAQHRGALLFLPHGGNRKDVLFRQVFEDYIRDNVDSWFRWSKKMKLPVGHMEDLILVTGCTLVSSWAAAVFDGHMSDPATIFLETSTKSNGSGAQFFWRNIRGNVDYHNSQFEPNVQNPLPQNQCAFIRGLRAKRRFFRTIIMPA